MIDPKSIKPNATVLDVTAGNRRMWGKRWNNPHVIFLDKVPGLRIQPDVVGVWEALPFPDDSFQLIVFDPNYYTRTGTPAPLWYRIHHGDPLERDGSWWGKPFNTYHEMCTTFVKAAREFRRVAPRMVMKWTDSQHPLPKVLTLFLPYWIPLYTKKVTTGSFKKNATGSTYWVSLIRKEEIML